MVNTLNGLAKAGAAQPNEPPPPRNSEQVIASILESRNEQTDLLRMLVEKSNCGGHGASNARGHA
jgi:hypothetical protein